MMTNPPAEVPANPGVPQGSGIEWQLVEQVAGDPWSAELVVWSGEGIDGLAIPLDDELVQTVAEVRRRRLQLAHPDQQYADPEASPPPDTGETDPEEEPAEGRAGRLWRGLGRTTGSTQADRWLENIPVRWQVIAAIVLLVLFGVMMLIGRLTA